jgi:hypothetical protein
MVRDTMPAQWFSPNVVDDGTAQRVGLPSYLIVIA